MTKLNPKAARAIVKHLDAINKKAKVRVVTPVSDITFSQQRVVYQCNACGTEQEQTLHVISNIKHGCRKCTNKIVNARKYIPDEQTLKDLRSMHRELNILAVIPAPLTRNGKSQGNSRSIVFACPKCSDIVTCRISTFKREGNLHMCLPCATDTFLSRARKTAYGFKKVKHAESGKVFRVQGYELDALKLLKAEGKNIKRVLGSDEIEPILYEFEGKERRYFPDLKYRNTIIEVKSEHTAGIKDSSNKYLRLRMLKAKAKACEAQGFKFRLILFIGDKRKGTLRQVILPKNWVDAKPRELKSLLGMF